VRIRLLRSRSNDDQAEADEERNGAENRRERKGVLGFTGDLDRAQVGDLFLVREGNSAGGESDDAKDDQNYSDDGDWLHGVAAFPGQVDGMPAGNDLDVPATAFLQALVDNSNQE
jgi:hypothetical protein